MPQGFTVKDGLCFGSRAEGLLEIKFHRKKQRNAMTGAMQDLLAELVEKA